MGCIVRPLCENAEGVGHLNYGIDRSLTQALSRLRRIYLLVNAVHGLNDADRAMLQRLDEQCQAASGTTFTLQAIITKADNLLRTPNGRGAIKDIQRDVFETAPTCLPAIVTAALDDSRLGIDEMRKSIAEACGFI